MFTFWLGKLLVFCLFWGNLHHLITFDILIACSASVDGRIYVWKITEGSDEEDKPQITGKIVIALQITGERENLHPRVCWHCHKQV